MIKTIEKLLVSSMLLFFCAFNNVSCQDTIVYKGLIAVELRNGGRFSPYSDGYDGIARDYFSCISVNSINVDSIYTSNNLFIEDDRGVLTETIRKKIDLSDMGNLLVISLKERKENHLIFYKFYSVEIEIQFSEFMLISAPNFEKEKKRREIIKFLEMANYHLLKVNTIEPYLIKDQFIQIK